MAMLPMTLGDP